MTYEALRQHIIERSPRVYDDYYSHRAWCYWCDGCLGDPGLRGDGSRGPSGHAEDCLYLALSREAVAGEGVSHADPA